MAIYVFCGLLAAVYLCIAMLIWNAWGEDVQTRKQYIVCLLASLAWVVTMPLGFLWEFGRITIVNRWRNLS